MPVSHSESEAQLGEGCQLQHFLTALWELTSSLVKVLRQLPQALKSILLPCPGRDTPPEEAPCARASRNSKP